jgi:broad specificity phosphatase PhoE
MKTIYYMRHGQSEANLKQIYGGQEDWSLTALGREQAQTAAQAATTYQIDTVISSDLSRAYDTAGIVANVLGIPRDLVRQDARLRELNLGKLTGTAVTGRSGYIDYAKNEHNGMEVETIPSIRARLEALLEDLETAEGKVILLVAHNGPGQILQEIFNPTINLNDAPDIPNAEIIKLGELG